jgi:hypothetical protein
MYTGVVYTDSVLRMSDTFDEETRHYCTTVGYYSVRTSIYGTDISRL